jgi:hypothetical protein
MRARRFTPYLSVFFPALALAVASSAWSRDARAASCTNPVVSTCINDDTLWPHAGAQVFMGVGGTETVAPGHVAFGLVTSYLSRPITLHVPAPGPAGSDQSAVNDQVNGTFMFSFGATERLQLDAILPVTFGQGGSGASSVSGGPGLADTATRDLRFGAAFAIVPRARVDTKTAGENRGAGRLRDHRARRDLRPHRR